MKPKGGIAMKITIRKDDKNELLKALVKYEIKGIILIFLCALSVSLTAVTFSSSEKTLYFFSLFFAVMTGLMFIKTLVATVITTKKIDRLMEKEKEEE